MSTFSRLPIGQQRKARIRRAINSLHPRGESLEIRLTLSVSFFDSAQELTGGSSIALGDLDGDGDLDAWIGRWGANAVFLNNGRGRFVDTGQQLGNSRTFKVALGDLDGDGDLDSWVANAGTDEPLSEQGPNRVYLNDGTGRFSDSGQMLGAASSRDVALADLDSDGDLDAFVGNSGYRFPGTYPDKVWINQGDGGFVDGQLSLGITGTDRVAVVDIDRDGDLDLWESSSESDTARFWLNDGDGQMIPSREQISGVQGIAFGDLNGDGAMDAFIAKGRYLDTVPHEVWINDGIGELSDSGQRLESITSTPDVELADLDNDGDLDAWVATSRGFACCDAPDRIWLNSGSGDFIDSGLRLGNAANEDVALGDLDGDGDLDAFVIGFDSAGIWIQGPFPGDANGDGVFDSSDLVQVFQIGEYEDDIHGNSTFEEGDWNLDGDFDSGDLVAAFALGTYAIRAKPVVGHATVASAVDWLLSDDDRIKKARAFASSRLVAP